MAKPARRRMPAPGWRVELFAGYWFVTAAVALAGPVLAAVVLLIDGAAGEAGVFGSLAISPDAARTILGSIAGSLITIASLTASLTIVTLQLLSSQYTPRTVRGFLRRKVSQVVSGAFVGIFLYCLVLLLFVREPGDENDPFVPSLGVVSSVVLATAALFLLVLFINALARTIQVSTMTSEIAVSTVEVIEDRSARTERPRSTEGLVLEHSASAAGVGFVRSTVPELIATAAPEGTRGVVRMVARPGDFVTPTTKVAVWLAEAGGAAWPEAAFTKAVRAAVLIGSERDLDDDPAFGIRQLTDIALRALSPGINDPSTAVICIGYLRQIFEALAACPLLPLAADQGGLRVEATERDFDEFVDMLAEIAAYAGGDLRVVEALADAELSAAAVAAASGFTERADRLHDEVAQLIAAGREGAATDRAAERLRNLEERAAR